MSNFIELTELKLLRKLVLFRFHSDRNNGVISRMVIGLIKLAVENNSENIPDNLILLW